MLYEVITMQPDRVLAIFFRDDIDHAGEGLRAVERGVASLDDFEAIDIRQFDERQVEVAGICAVELDAVKQDDDFVGIPATHRHEFPPAEFFVNLDAVFGAQKVSGVDIPSYNFV